MRVLACGPESCGTHLLQDVLAACPQVGQAVHRSMPHGGSWLNLDKMGVHRWVVITRERDYAAKSAVRNGHVSTLTEARSRYDLAMSLLEAQLHEDGNRVVWVTYEQLVADPAAVVNSIATAWGVDPWPIDDLDVYDGNERYRPKPKPEPDAE